MTRSSRVWWIIYGSCTVAVALTMIWITTLVLKLEKAETDARGRAEYQESLRLALWRMDSWLAPLIAREEARPYYEYLPYYSTPTPNYTKVLETIAPGEVLTPSPLLTYTSDFVRLHFRIGSENTISSPQVPIGSQKDLAANTCTTLEAICGLEPRLELVQRLIDPSQAVNFLTRAEQEITAFANDFSGAAPAQKPPVLRGKTLQEWNKRVGNRIQSQYAQTQGNYHPPNLPPSADEASQPRVSSGPMVPLWLEDPQDPGVKELVYLRRVTVRNEHSYQGFLTDWPKIRTTLLDEISDLFARPSLVPAVNLTTLEKNSGLLLATAPILLDASPLDLKPYSGVHPTRLTLICGWIGIAVAILMVGVALNSSIVLGEKRKRFASAITHELRTPLTTFQMYSEMLAEDMVKGETKRREYLETLKRESARLSRLVENVLSYARLEEGRSEQPREERSVGELLDLVTPPLVRRAEEAGMKLHLCVASDREADVALDSDAIGQILFNLIDNACKYAGRSPDKTLALEVKRNGSWLSFIARDHGPGICDADARSVFSPFDRGGQPSAGEIPGIGLGLALCRDLARDLGGSLELEETPGGGATFILKLPLASQRNHRR